MEHSVHVLRRHFAPRSASRYYTITFILISHPPLNTWSRKTNRTDEDKTLWLLNTYEPINSDSSHVVFRLGLVLMCWFLVHFSLIFYYLTIYNYLVPSILRYFWPRIINNWYTLIFVSFFMWRCQIFGIFSIQLKIVHSLKNLQCFGELL